MYKISDSVKNLITKTMENRKVELTAGGQNLAEVKIQRRIFNDDLLSPLCDSNDATQLFTKKYTGSDKL